ncbi:hypothetical protein [Parasedimentitalea psychrophila]|uniref:Uncharacterized protein n=1 Tax=Parasedimentitalea psychrophila TaxID=2997337 RepID=A0A9Y2P883_9RHOB|nr:hypothetical protein [Parasedimentitalea psychrophila]WIY26625.1 hypothetical protein QPJ95_06830 [Parasedimentitalea psychrophila]
METNFSASANNATWQFIPQNSFVSIALTVLFLYVFVRHFILVLMIMDIVIGWLRKFRWFPVEGKRLRAFVHWLAAIAVFSAFLAASGRFGWIEFVPV